MFILGHAGISLLVAYMADRALARSAASPVMASSSSTLGVAPAQRMAVLSRAGRLMTRIDYRLVLVGALLPDITDKLLSLWILPDIFPATRTVGHTGLFNGLLLLAAVLLLVGTRRSGPMVLALASTAHLLLDRTWRVPEVLWWPAQGWRFRPDGIEDVWTRWWEALHTQPSVYVPEIVGGLALAWIAYLLWRRRGWLRFLRLGTLT